MAQNVGPLLRDGKQNVLLLDRTNAGVAPTITTTSLPNGRVGVAYSKQLTATGDGPIEWSYVGSLPPGLGIPASGLVSGTPTAPWNAIITVTAKNWVGSASKTLSLLVPNGGTGGRAPRVMTVLLSPETAIVAPGGTAELQATVKDESASPIPNIVGSVVSSEPTVVTGIQLDVTDESGQAFIRVAGDQEGTSEVSVVFDNVTSSTVEVTTSMQQTTKKLLVVGLDSDSFGDVGVSGAVFTMPPTGRLFGTPLGEFSGKTIDSQGSLKVDASEFNGGSLAVGTKVIVCMENADEFSPRIEAEIIEE